MAESRITAAVVKAKLHVLACDQPCAYGAIANSNAGNTDRALLSAAPSPETLIPPLSLPLPRLSSHVHSNICCERPVPCLPFTSPSTSTSAGIGNVGGGGDDDSGDDDGGDDGG
jgi:hypothetical protein